MDVDALVQALGELAVMSPAAKCASAAVVAGAFAPSFPARFAAKDLRYAMAAADSVRSEVRMIRAAHLVVDRLSALYAAPLEMQRERLQCVGGATQARIMWADRV